jgi:LysR family nitrogen assimilation transcriptional regulator
MDLKQLEYFVRVAEMGSFTRAAIALNVAQPALSRQIRLLEVELRQNLLARNGRGATPTEAGKLLLEHGRGILHQVDVAREELGVARGALAGRVSIGLPPSLSRLITVPLTQALRAQLPQAQVTLTEGFSVSMVDGLRLGKLDMAVLYNPERSPDLELSTLHEEELVLISPRTEATPARKSATGKAAAVKAAAGKGAGKHPVQPAGKARARIGFREVTALPLILPSRPNAFRLLIDDEALRIGCPVHPKLEVDGLNGILNLVKEGMGHAVLPAYTLSNFENAEPFELRSIHTPRLMGQLMLVRSARRPTTETQKTARALVQDVVLKAIAPYV